ncbi:MAG: hypothetical protein IPQ23_02555 [Cytophagaceae bacterium]|nr:hypothetical protein [Cytophagaceae bacterium]
MEIENENQQENGSTHVKLIKEIGDQIKITNRADYRTFKNKINDLKGVRVIADYKDELIEKDKAINALTFAKEVHGTLLRNFNI